MSDNGKVGFLELLTSAIRTPLEARTVQARRDLAIAEWEEAQAERAQKILEETVQVVEPERDGFVLIGSDTRKLTEDEQGTLRDNARKFATGNTHSIGYLDILKHFVMGRGVEVSPELEDEVQLEELEEHWKAFREWNNWDTLEDEIPKRTWRDGEAFIRKFVSDGQRPRISREARQALRDVDISALEDVESPPDGMVMIRFMDPKDVQDPKGKVSHGIITAEDDVQTVLGYMWAPDGKLKEVVPASQVIHTKIRVDSDVKRGRSALEPIMQRAKQYEQWLDYRLKLNLIRTALVLIRKVKGTPSQVSSIRDAQQTDRDNINTRRQKMLKAGTTITSNDAVDHELHSPNLQATDAQKDGRQILLTMAAATNIAEYMFTGDASNANFASTLVAESPTHRTFVDWQDFFKPVWERIWRWVMTEAAEANLIRLSADQVSEIPLQVSYPPLQQRDIEALAKALQIARLEKIISKQGMAEELGIDWEVERERLEKEGMDDFEFTPPPAEEPEQEEEVNV